MLTIWSGASGAIWALLYLLFTKGHPPRTQAWGPNGRNLGKFATPELAFEASCRARGCDEKEIQIRLQKAKLEKSNILRQRKRLEWL